jgi:O-antigen/teichoic acid export membrane protein
VSLRSNLVANVLGQFWGTALGILMVPYYLQHLGIEAYALIGFNAVLQMWLALLDMGLSPTLGREVARYRAGEASARDTAGLLFSLEKIFGVLGVILVAAVWSVSGVIGAEWFKPGQLSMATIQTCVVYMGAMAGLRWLSGLYRGAIVGLERLVWLNTVASVVYTVRFAGVVPLLMIWPSVELFFAFQAASTLLELIVLRIYLAARLPAEGGVGAAFFSWAIIRRHGRFSLSLAFTAAVWVVVTQSDKLLLSRLLPLATYGYFALAVLVASGISIISFSLLQSFQPRFNFLAAKQGIGGPELTGVYHLTTQITVAAVLPAAIVMALWPESVLYAWTGDRAVASASAQVLPFYAMGNAILAVMSLPYYLQIAHGYLRLHVIGNILFATTLIPLVWWAALKYGAAGASLLWFCQNLVFLVGWPPLVHHFLLPGQTRRWYFEDLLMPVAAALCVALAVKLAWPVAWSVSRWLALAQCVITGILVLVATVLAAPQVRRKAFASVRALAHTGWSRRPRAS